MGPRKMVLATAALAALVGVASGGSFLDQFTDGRLDNLHVRKFLVGHLEVNTNRFIARSGRNEQAVLRDEILYFEFSGPIDLDSLSPDTVRIGTPTSTGDLLPTKGSYYRYVVNYFDPVSSTFQPKRSYRNRFLYDPTNRQETSPYLQNPDGFDADTPFVVILPGADRGAVKTVKMPSGSPLWRTFRTTDGHVVDYGQPFVLLLEASDAPGIPLDGRTDVDPRADVVAYFCEPMLTASFDPATTFRLFDLTAGVPVSGTVLPPADTRVATFRVDPAYGGSPREVEVTLSTGLLDRYGNTLDRTVTARFTTLAGP